MNALQPWHLIILVLVVVLLFGAKRLPDAARSVGKSMKIFKAETKDMRKSGQDGDAEAGTPQAAEADTRQLPQSTPQAAEPVTPTAQSVPTASAPQTGTAANTDEQVQQLQRQLDDLKRQQSAQETQRNAG
ncbi:twin-arginine translocase TatA/TatE family subunit [Saccharomonospora piscinae]|uniref:Sec-independent protein translocase subunit TatA n=1 Tax=Saccharomonospora piscinae TaxID=687388 RepID=UPI001105A39F|nr:Sec-independent protein translocase subunit TatA [Saccharomonospora piscinae]TLW94439.1 twin-arginine translocase TatA/TatE family subunit [Saccharomonospora piscinae]